MGISKTPKSVVEYQSHGRHDEKYSRPNKNNDCYQNQPKIFKSFPKISSSLSGRRTKSSIKQRNIGVSLSNLDMKDISHKVKGRKV